jgi:transcriptional regulator
MSEVPGNSDATVDLVAISIRGTQLRYSIYAFKMYLREVHAEPHIPSLREFVIANPLGILTTAIKSPNYPLLQSSHIPWVYDVDPSSENSLGRLRGHMARANPHSKALVESAEVSSTQLQEDVMVLFNGAVDSYVTPRFYTETKPKDGKVVPTWNYSAVQAYGKATIYFGADASTYLSKQVRDLTNQSEERLDGTAWKVEDAPDSYVELLKKAIIGIEIEVTSLGGKFKMSQEMGKEDRAGIVNGFQKLGSEAGLKMAQTIKERGEKRDAEKALR